MGVDHEIDVINNGIGKVYEVLYKINYQLDSTLVSLNGSLNKVDQGIETVVEKVGGIEDQIINVTGYFPLEVTYYLILLILIVVLYVLIAYLIYHSYELYSEIKFRSDKIVRNYMKKVYQSLPRRDSLENIETPPPTYDEYVKTADLYVRYHKNGSVTTSLQSQPAI